MKKSIVALFAICSFVIASCGSDTGKVEEAKEEAKELTEDLVEEMDEAAESVDEAVDSLSTEMEVAE